MSKSVTIPTFMLPDFVCTINTKTYRYKAGTTQTVPDAVAELIENINASVPVENPPETEEEMAKRVAEQAIEDNVTAATETDAGIVKMAGNVAEATSETLVDTVNAMISAFIEAGQMAAPAEEEEE